MFHALVGDECKTLGAESVLCVTCDVASDDDIKRVLQQVGTFHGRLGDTGQLYGWSCQEVLTPTRLTIPPPP